MRSCDTQQRGGRKPPEAVERCADGADLKRFSVQQHIRDPERHQGFHLLSLPMDFSPIS